MTLTISKDEEKRLEEVMSAGVETLNEIQVLKDGLKDTVNAIAEELKISDPKITPQAINAAIKMAQKGNYGEQQEKLDLSHEILAKSGYDK